MYRIFLNFAKSYISFWLLKFYNKKTFLAVFEIQALKAEIKGVLAGHSVAMVTYCVTEIILCSLAIGQFLDTMIVASIIDRVVIMTHQNLSLGMCWKLF